MMDVVSGPELLHVDFWYISSDLKCFEEGSEFESIQYHLKNHNLWDIIVNGDLEEEAEPEGEKYGPPAPKTAKQLTAKRNQERVKSILLLAIPDKYLLKFHNVTNEKSLWVAIKTRFGGNDESKKMQRNVLKHQFDNFTTAPNERLDKAYDRFQKLISQLEVHAALVSKEDINQKFLRSLPPSWSQIALIMRNKLDIDQIDIDDLYNNLRVYEDEMKRSTSSTSNSQNLAFLFSKNTSSTNEVSPASGYFRVSTVGGTSSSSQVSSTICADEKTGKNLDFKGKQPVGFDKSKVECYNCHRTGHFARECKSRRNQGKRSYGDNGRRNAPTNEPSSQALVAQDGLGGYDWSNDFDELVNYALMSISSSNSLSSSDNEVQNCSKQCLESFKTLQKNYDSEREKHNRARLEIHGYKLALESLESRILGHEKNELAWGEKYVFQNYKIKCREVKINNLKIEIEKVVKERDELSSDEEITPTNDRFSKADGYHVVPPPIIGNFLTLRADISFTGKTNEVRVEIPKTIDESVVSKPKINKDKVIIEDWNSDDEDDVSEVKTVSPVKTNETQTVKNQVDKIGQISQKEGIRFKKIKSCFVCLVNHVRPNGKRAVHSVSTASPGNREIFLQDHTVVDSGCSSHMTGNKAYLSDYDDYNGGFMAFGSDPKRENSVLFIDTECLILSPSFKLLDESQVVLRASRQNDVYILDLKNIVRSGGY
ncbi:putative ribonuclease H-like domain-containing protein [Tanacetum coccineum]